MQQTWLAVDNTPSSENSEHSWRPERPPRALDPGAVIIERGREDRTGKRIREIRFHASDLVGNES